jgi:SAM-dependent methyltransferase
MRAGQMTGEQKQGGIEEPCVFREPYAQGYDEVYRDKDYAHEAEAVHRLIEQNRDGAVRSIVDIGCGTGRHAACFANRGYDVTGIDQSAGMLAVARERAGAPTRGTLQFFQGDARSFALGRTFDAALMMFHVIGYLPANDDLLAALERVHRHLRPGGLFIFDFWYGPAVLADPPRSRWRTIKTHEASMLRLVESVHDPHRQCCDVTIRVVRTHAAQILDDSEEVHRVRYFFPLEIELALRISGLRLRELKGFPEIGLAPSLTTWSVVGIAARP